MTTSKEIIIDHIEALKEQAQIEIEQNTGMEAYCEIEINRFKKVLKDLEILEILKETIKNNVFDVAMLDDRPNGETLLSCDDFGIELKTEDYWKIVGWVRQ